MTDGTLDTTGAKPAVRLSRYLPDPPAVVWRAITEREQLKAWFPCDVVVEGGRWAVGAAITCSTRMSGSTASVTPLGSVRSPACTEAPMAMPSTSTSMPGGMLVASASSEIWTSCWSSSPSGATSPVTLIGTSTVTFSPRLTMIRSTCSTEPLIASRWTALGSASWLPPGRPSSRISTFAVRSASSTSCPGRLTCRGSVPWPYRTAGTRPARRSLRAGPLPNSVRGSAAMRTSGTVKLLNYTKVNPKESSREPAAPRPHRPRGRLRE